ncbi:MAG: 2-C-methyl-D-erythritol 2,4-cyclodiphosphate synthase, partial [Eubacteriales bacterium]
DRMVQAGYRIGNVDVTVIAQAPKLAPFIPAMRAHVASVLGTAPDRISIKATTEERLGFTGAGEGIAAHAVCLLEEA